MCGIAGIVSKSGVGILSEITAMTDLVVHRGPDAGGQFLENCLALGHRRLAIIDVSAQGAQPMHYLDKYVIVFNGEIYNYVELRQELSLLGYLFASHTDTEVIMAAYDHWGADCLGRFNGMWAFALYDKPRQLLFCARDRFGVKPFYYLELADKFAFASEIKQFTALSGWRPQANPARLNDYLISNGVHDHTAETLFAGVSQLRGGERLEYCLKRHSYRIGKWYDLPRRISPFGGDFEEAVAHFRTLLLDAVRLRLRSDVRVGSCLSGGLDSSSIVCLINKLLTASGQTAQQATVSSCFVEKEADEQEFLDQVVQATQTTNYKVFPSFDGLLAQLDRVLWHQDEPFGSSRPFAQWTVYQEARSQGLIVMLDGQGADEFLGGYAHYHAIYFRELVKSLRFIELARSINNYRALYRSDYQSPYADILVTAFLSCLPPSLAAAIRSPGSRRSPFPGDRGIWKIANPAGLSADSEFRRTRCESVRQQSEINLRYDILPQLLHHQDRNSMAHSVEARQPFLDYRLVEFGLGLSSAFKIGRSVRKRILREAMRGTIPDAITDRYDKLGFATPQARWIRVHRAALRPLLTEACERLSDYVDMDAVPSILGPGLEKDSLNPNIWRILCAGRWAAVFGVSP
jgi:asparagine synthase (glutamine-hydrolysing)